MGPSRELPHRFASYFQNRVSFNDRLKNQRNGINKCDNKSIFAFYKD